MSCTFRNGGSEGTSVVAQGVAYPLSKHKALISNPSPAKRKEKEKIIKNKTKSKG
jgi:hypothetical protein